MIASTFIHRIPFQRLQCTSRRNFSIKELSWCASNDSSPQQKPRASSNETCIHAERQKLKPPIDAFGIVAAMSRNRVIGVDGKIPWDLPEDRKAFTALTRDKIIIIGRRTFEEQPNQSHIAHAHSCIIVSETLPDNFFEASNRLRLARSFPEALAMADELIDRSGASSSADEDEKNVDCWVAGGEQIYKEALMHPSARLVHLTIVDTEIDLVAGQVARFPAKYRWDNKFVKAETKDSSQDSDRHGFTRYVYRRPKLQR